MGKKCGRCSTRYCGPACQKQHWDGGHKDVCKRIKKAGGAEQYNANEKYSKAVAVAVEKCADDTKGQTCYICTQALHWKTKEGLVRGCSCRGTAGFAHVSCLAEQAKILVAEAFCYAFALIASRRFNDAKALMRKTLPVGRRILGDTHEYTFRIRSLYAEALYKDDGATLDDLREAVATLVEIEPIARRVLGTENPVTLSIVDDLQDARAALRARETPEP